MPAKTPEARIKPELLIWARTTIGFSTTEAAHKVGVSEDRLLSWEEGDARPTIAQLRNLARVYKRPLAVFYLPSVPKDFQPLRDFRRLPDSETGKLSPNLNAAIRRAHFQRDVALELRELTDEPVAGAPRIDIPPTDPEDFAAAARALLGINLVTQKSWPDPRKALASWIEALENLDVLVLQAQRISTSEMRGFSISEPRLPVLVLNGADWPRARIFTLLHEYAHVLMHSSGVCDLHERAEAAVVTDVEVQCNQIAAAVLMPRDALLQEAALANPPSDGVFLDDTLRILSEHYSVSREVVVRRLFTLGLTDWNYLQSKIQELQQTYQQAREEADLRRRTDPKHGGPSYYVMTVRDLGRSYIRTALDAYHQDAITASYLADALQIKLPNLPGIEEQVAKGVVAE